MRERYPESELIEAVRSSTSIRQVLSKFGLAEAGGNYSIVKRRIQTLGISTAHFNRQGWRKGTNKPVVIARPLSHLLKQGTHFQSDILKKRLFAEDQKTPKCESCLKTEWLGKPVALELAHINGNSTDNR